MTNEIFSIDRLWKQVLAELELTITRGSFTTFFALSKLIELKNNVARISCSSQYFCDLTEKRYYSLIKEILDRITKQNNSLVFELTAKKNELPMTDLGPLFSQPNRNLDAITFAKKRANLEIEFTFENFCVSSSNEMAYAAATAVARSPGDTYNPLFLYGGVGVGKTHLMHAIGHKLIEKKPEIKAVYCVGEEFTNEIIEAIREKTTKNFREKYRRADVLLIDDIQFIAGKEKVQEEFFHTFNSIQRAGGQVVLTSDKEPSEIRGLEARLRSRFEGGLAIDIQIPDFELRTAILLTKAKQKKVDITIDVAKLIAASVDSTRKLEGILTKVQAFALFKKQPISVELTNTVLGKKDEENNGFKNQAIEPKEILSSVCKFYSLKQTDITSACRKKSFSFPRQILMYLLRVEYKLPLEEVGIFIGGRDHTTIMHGVGKITGLMASSEKIREEISQIKRKLSG